MRTGLCGLVCLSFVIDATGGRARYDNQLPELANASCHPHLALAENLLLLPLNIKFSMAGLNPIYLYLLSLILSFI